MKKMKKSDTSELQRIQETIPEDIKKRLMRSVKITPIISKLAREAVEMKDDSDPNKERIQTLIDAGVFDKKEDVENKTAIAELNKYLETEIAKSVLAGRLSKPKDLKVMDKYKKICRKLSRTQIKKS